jgi:hypothetical protein
MTTATRERRLPKTGPFPKSPKDPLEFRREQMKGMKTFKGGSVPNVRFGSIGDNTSREKDRGPYGSLKTSGGGNAGNSVSVKDGNIKQKPRPRTHMTERLPVTKNTFGQFHPTRGEGPQ